MFMLLKESYVMLLHSEESERKKKKEHIEIYTTNQHKSINLEFIVVLVFNTCNKIKYTKNTQKTFLLKYKFYFFDIKNIYKYKTRARKSIEQPVVVTKTQATTNQSLSTKQNK